MNEYVLYFFFFTHLGPNYEFKEDSNSFLFTLVNPSKREHVKIPAKPRGDCGGIHCQTSLCPCFGSSNFYNLKICECALSDNFRCRVFDQREGFETPAKNKFSSYFTGRINTDLEVSELEVFTVNI